jgi:hypothetical protein
MCIGLLLIIATGGCDRHAKRIDNEALRKEFRNAPDWVLTGGDDDMFSAVGSARIGKGGLQFARTEAMAHGLGELARQVAVKVRSLVNSFVQQTGIGDDQTLDSFSRQVSKLVTDEVLSGSRQKDMWISPAPDVYVLMILDKDAVEASVRHHVISGYQQDSARWQQFQAQRGNEELEREIEKAFGE